jgi:hypothetical protein
MCQGPTIEDPVVLGRVRHGFYTIRSCQLSLTGDWELRILPAG